MTTHPRRRKSLAERIDMILSLPALKKRPKVKLLLICLTRHVNKEDIAWPRVERIVQETDISTGYVGTICKQLEELGYMERKKLKKGDAFPNGVPVIYSQYIYYLSPELFNEQCEPNWKPGIFKTMPATKPLSLSETGSKAKPLSPSETRFSSEPLSLSETRSGAKPLSLSETGSGAKPLTPSRTNKIHSVPKPVSPSEPALYDRERKNKKEQFGQVHPTYRKPYSRIDELSKIFETDEPISPDFLRRVIAEAVEDKIPLSKSLRDTIQLLEKRQLLSRLPNGKIADIGWRSPTPLSQLINIRQPNAGNGLELDMIINRITKTMNIDPSNTQ